MTDTCTSQKPLRRSVFVHIEGRVQGVGFRAFVELRARGLGLNGWVRNRRDGGVEAVFSGPSDAVQTMIYDCHRGPSFARVMFVRVRDETDAVADGFIVRATV
jgi:acylphosphatase